jgi:hypothetical protein
MIFMLFASTSENILDARLIEQFERRISCGNSTASDPYAHKRGPKPKSWKDKKGQKKSESESQGGPEQEEKTTEPPKPKMPAFMMPTASGRTPKMATRYEEKPAETSKGTSKGSPASAVEAAAGKKRGGSSFEKTVMALERDLKLLPRKIKKEIKEEIVESENEQDEEDGESEDDQEKVQLTEWFPPDTWSYLQKVFVTDVTVDDITVTMRECRTPEGFFSQTAAV